MKKTGDFDRLVERRQRRGTMTEKEGYDREVADSRKGGR